MAGIIGAFIAMLLLGWLATRAAKVAKVRSGRHVVDYGRAVKITGWIFAVLALFIVYAATQASDNQAWIGAVIGGTPCMSLFVEFHFVRVEFDDKAVYTHSPWRGRRTIPWNEIVAYRYSEINRWHVLKTQRSGSIRLSVLLSGLGTLLEELKKKGIHG